MARAQTAVVLNLLGYVFSKQDNLDFFNTIGYKDEILASSKIMELRQTLAVPEPSGIGAFAPVLPNPAFFDVVGDEIEFDDCLFDQK